MNSWGKHLIVDAADCDKDLIKNEQIVAAFAKRLVKDIDMVAYGEPQVVNFGSGNKEGFTLVQLIETSNICAHFCNETGDAYFDVFSCKDFDPDVVMEIIDQFFRPETMRFKVMERDARAND